MLFINAIKWQKLIEKDERLRRRKDEKKGAVSTHFVENCFVKKYFIFLSLCTKKN